MTDNVLSSIPGEILGAAGYSLPAAESSTDNTQRVIVKLPDGRCAEVTFVRLKSKKGRTTRSFWTPDSAVLVEHWEPTPENINALPDPVRHYIMHLETLCEPAGLV